MYQRVMVAVDGSPTSGLALDEALKLASEGGAQLLLLHVIEDAIAMWNGGDWLAPSPPLLPADWGEQVGQRILDHSMERVRRAGLDAATRQVEDAGRRTGAVIAEEAHNWGADLLVIGTHGRKGFDHFLLGSVAEVVIRTATVPVLLVRGK